MSVADLDVSTSRVILVVFRAASRPAAWAAPQYLRLNSKANHHSKKDKVRFQVLTSGPYASHFEE